MAEEVEVEVEGFFVFQKPSTAYTLGLGHVGVLKAKGLEPQAVQLALPQDLVTCV